MDVRMLGNGRPFVLEFEVPEDAEVDLEGVDFEELGRRVKEDSNGAVEVLQLRRASAEDFAGLQSLAERKLKSYAGVCWLSEAVTREKLREVEEHCAGGFELRQKTPIRVLQRRSNLERPKRVCSLRFELLNPHWVIVHMKTEAGTFVQTCRA